MQKNSKITYLVSGAYNQFIGRYQIIAVIFICIGTIIISKYYKILTLVISKQKHKTCKLTVNDIF